jgi:hypothetical protein
VNVVYRSAGATEGYLQAFLRVTTPTHSSRDTALPEGYQENHLLWSPDSKSFFVNGGNGGSYWGFWVYVYLADDPAMPIDVVNEARRDMLNAFPPCKAAYPNNRDAAGCKEESRNKDISCDKLEPDPEYASSYNMTGIDWVSSSVILVVAHIPCSTSHGGIMCQVMGYELEVPSGRILKRISAKQLKLESRISRIPDPPKYCPTPGADAPSSDGLKR